MGSRGGGSGAGRLSSAQLRKLYLGEGALPRSGADRVKYRRAVKNAGQYQRFARFHFETTRRDNSIRCLNRAVDYVIKMYDEMEKATKIAVRYSQQERRNVKK